ncbi:MAG TPA: DivIVA domain-containing protein [Solirubrobacteraceae bacterium]|nr:DivIVA domain-containing protein [Solirubrobacteraceae bacterium]
MATHFKQTGRTGSTRINFAPIKDLFKPVRAPEPDDQATERWLAFAREAEPGPADDVLPRFPIVRQGYDCPAVDEYITELERELAEADRELAEVRIYRRPADEVNQELKRIGEQTSAVLIAAHEQRDEILRTAREEANRSVSEAAAHATTLVSDAQTQVRRLETQSQATRLERDRLLADVRRVSAALAALADPPQESAATPKPSQAPPEAP